MKQRALGNSGIMVSEIGLGALAAFPAPRGALPTNPKPWGSSVPPWKRAATFRHCTGYGRGRSEEIPGRGTGNPCAGG